MSLLQARIDSEQTEPIWQAARAVFAALERGNLDDAARGLTPACEVFGHDAAMALPALAKLLATRELTPHDLALLPSGDVNAIAASEQSLIFAGPIAPPARVGVVHLKSTRADATVSLGLVFVKTAPRLWRVQRIFDPIPFATRAA